mmetsp:Transcript_31918/g.53825  ORF Transcript_31918/g.53825 Transcript_31918/m.53825 type:complete len:196 (+) Transcript_31918:72-659(+)|eukprot:CAMPEP_0184652104 /NCGR_PEP_ID=MMETSP0308-20130426/9784_1 /TAXON_ID=38269 /ORGANISM="Gloeochaete witrockiana, Strain SAG 46.84" /LENGTH=195 /DNA_ID=CAMNT_0027086777 /DNA_START=63 /DNA_END=650 /DNA_ORIENTATION=-
MFTARKKIQKEKNAEPTEFEESVAQALFDLEVSAADLKADLRDLYIVGAREVDVKDGKKAVVILVPFRLLKQFHKIQQRLVRELEKKFSGKHVVVIANRRIMPKPQRRNRARTQRRPRSRTLSSVHDAIMEDLVFPTEIVGKRMRVHVDATKTVKIFLDPKDQANVEYKLDTFTSVYKKMTGKEVKFLFPVIQAE